MKRARYKEIVRGGGGGEDILSFFLINSRKMWLRCRVHFIMIKTIYLGECTEKINKLVVESTHASEM